MLDRLRKLLYPWLSPWVAVASILVCSIARADVDTHGDIDWPPRPFTLLVIDAPAPSPAQSMGGFGQVPRGFDFAFTQNRDLMGWISHPQTEQFKKWLSLSTIKRLPADSPIVREHHADILVEAESLPAIALVDSAGGRWALFSGSTYPKSEYELARKLDVYYAAVMQAAKEVGVNAVQTLTPAQYAQRRNANYRGGLFDPTFEPTINPTLNLPDGGFPLDMNAKATVDTLTLAVIAGSVVVLVLGSLVGVWIYCEAITSPSKRK